MTESNSTRIAFQTVAIVSLCVVLFERASRLLREMNGQGRDR